LYVVLIQGWQISKRDVADLATYFDFYQKDFYLNKKEKVPIQGIETFLAVRIGDP